MRWINSAGGPLVLIPRSVLSAWRGAAHDQRGETDYAAACTVSNYAGVIHKHGVDVLVLNDEPLQTTAVATEDGMLLVRWMYAPSESSILTVLSGIRDRLEAPCEQVFWVSKEREHVLLDAASAGTEANDYLEINVGTGPHRIETHVWKPQADIGLLVHVLRSNDYHDHGAR